MMLEHSWAPDIRKGTPVLACTRCPIVWWPDRNRPRSTCTPGR